MAEESRGGGKKRGRSIVLVFLLFAAIGGGWIYYETGVKPHISLLYPQILGPDGVIDVRGLHFGGERANSSLLVDGIPLTTSSYVHWNDTSISIRLPSQSDSGVVVVRTAWGESNPSMFINQNYVPQKAEAAASATTGPVIESISPSEAKVGSLVTIVGINFGSSSQPGAVRFPRSSQAAQTGSAPTGSTQFAAQNLPYVEPTEDQGMYESWDDKKILVRVPDGAGSGNVLLHTDRGDSNPVTLRILNASASKYAYDPAVYSLQEKVVVRSIQAKTSPILDVYLPLPPNSPSQRLLAIQEQSPQPPAMSAAGYELYRFQNFESGKTVELKLQVLVSVEAVESSLDGYSLGDVEKTQAPFLLPYLASDAKIPAADPSILSGVTAYLGGEANPQKKVAKLWDWMQRTIRWTPVPLSAAGKPAALEAFKSHKADSESYVFLACTLLRAAKVPAVPVSGVLVKKSGETVPHFWLEYYLSGVGWIPFDPILGLGVKPGQFDAGLDDPSHYLGSLDNHHIAVTRGILDVGANLHTNSRTVSGVAPWSLQTLFEESSGLSYASSWTKPEVLGAY